MAIRGGNQLERVLARTVTKLTSANTVRVGFLEGATYPARSRSADKLLKGLDKLNRVGPFQKGQRPSALRRYRASVKLKAPTFVGPIAPAIVLSVATVAYWNNFGNARIPARAFFSNMIAEKSPNWGSDLTKVLLAANYDSKIALGRMGVLINDQLVKSIVDWPADNAPLTVAIKGFNKGLIDKGVMQRSTGYQVLT
jgi:hypothetical protein